MSAREMEVIRSGLPDSGDRAKGILPWRRILASKDFLLVTYSYFCYGYVAYIFFTWFFIYLSTVRGLNLRESSYFATLPFIAMAICSPAGGVLSDFITRRYGKRWGRCGVSVVVMGLAAVFVASGIGRRQSQGWRVLFWQAEPGRSIYPRACSGPSPPISRASLPGLFPAS